MKLIVLCALIFKFHQANCDYYDYDGLHSECKLFDGTKGQCIYIKNCPSALRDLKFRGTPKTCWFEGFEPVVCCKAASPIGYSPCDENIRKTTTTTTERTSGLENTESIRKTTTTTERTSGLENTERIGKTTTTTERMSSLEDTESIGKTKTTTERTSEKSPYIQGLDNTENIGNLVINSNVAEINSSPDQEKTLLSGGNSSGDPSEYTTIISSTPDLFYIPDSILNPPPPRLIIPQELPEPKTSREQRIYECWEHHRFYRDPEDQFLVGGTDSLAFEFPHMAALGYGSEDEPVWACGGSLISYRYVLTAAHCVNSRELGQVKFIRLGDLNLQSTTDDAQPRNYTVKRAVMHPDYKPPRQYNDIALLELNETIARGRNDYINPTCLHDEREINAEVLYATGWGKLSYDGQNSDHLQKAEFREFKFEECSGFYRPTRRLVDGIQDETQICAGEEGRDTCQGDSGGPLQINTTEYYRGFKLVGIISFGRPCGVANSPGVYTRVSSFIEWIESIVWPPKN